MVKELVDHLGTFDRNLVDRAITAAIAKTTEWPPVSLIIKCVNELRDLPPPGRPAWKDDDGESYHAHTPEEVAHRVAQCLAWRKQYGFNAATVKADEREDDLESLKRPFSADELASAGRLTGKGEGENGD